MNCGNRNFLIGYVEQAVGSGYDPSSPAISISCNGTLSKWRDKIHFLDLRLNDPGLKKYKSIFAAYIHKANELGIEVFLTIPEYLPTIHEPPPDISIENMQSQGRTIPVPFPKRKVIVPMPLVTFKMCLLAVPRTVTHPDRYYTLSIEECLSVIDLAREHGVKNIIIPTSRPGLFLDPAASEEFRSKMKPISAAAKTAGITLHVRTGGLSFDLYRRLYKECGCMLALDTGWAHLERNDLVSVFDEFKENIQLLLLHQVQPGIDKWLEWEDALAFAWGEYTRRFAEWRSYPQTGDEAEKKTLARLAYDAYKAYNNLIPNELAYRGVFQAGDINFVPLLKALRNDRFSEHERYLLLETVPNIKNTEFLARYLLSDPMVKAF